MSPAAKWQHFRDSRGPATLGVLLVLTLLAIGLAVLLVTAPQPWDNRPASSPASALANHFHAHFHSSLWWGAAAGMAAVLVGLASAKWWSLPHIAVFPRLRPPSRSIVRWTWLFALAATLLAIWPRYPRLDHSLSEAEILNLRYSVPGGDQPIPNASPVTVGATIYSFGKTLHHLWCTEEVKVGPIINGHDRAAGNGFSERRLRTTPFISGLLTVTMLVLVGAAMGSPRAGLAAGMILALHPWHVRWSVETGGVSTMVLGVTAGLLCLIRALETNRWRWWLGLSLTQTIFLLSSAGSFYVAAAQNLIALLCIMGSGTAPAVRASSASRLLLSGIFAFIPAALFMKASLPWNATHLAEAHSHAAPRPNWFNNLWAHLSTGLLPNGDAPGLSAGLGVNDLMAIAPWRGWMFYGILPLLAATGVFFLFRQDWRTRLVAGSLLLGGCLAGYRSFAGTGWITGDLVFLVVLFALALAWAGKGIQALHAGIPAALPLFLAVLFSLTTSPARQKMTTVPRQPIREAVAAMRGSAPGKADSRILTTSFGEGARHMLLYDPGLCIVKSPAELNALTSPATGSHRSLFLCFRDRAGMEKKEPELLSAVSGDPRWQRLPDIKGMEAMWSYELYRFAPESVDSIRLQP